MSDILQLPEVLTAGVLRDLIEQLQNRITGDGAADVDAAERMDLITQFERLNRSRPPGRPSTLPRCTPPRCRA